MDNIVTVHDKQFKPYIVAEKIIDRVGQMSIELSKQYEEKNPLFLGILNGSFIFAADLFRNLSIPAEISFVKLASYSGIRSTGNVTTLIGLEESLTGRHVIIVEDIIDTGRTLSNLIPNLETFKPASVAISTLLLKPKALIHPIDVDYVGFEVPNDFLLGYGLDYDGHGRNLKDIYKLV
jgi:hypoxanthine phosphoribosyltransferase